MNYQLVSADNRTADIQTELNVWGVDGYKVALALSVVTTVEILMYQENAMSNFDYRVRRVFNSVDDIQASLNEQALDSYYLIQSWISADYVTLILFKQLPDDA